MIDERFLNQIIRYIGSPANIHISGNAVINGIGYIFRTDMGVQQQVKNKSLNQYKEYWKEIIIGAEKRLFTNAQFTHRTEMFNRINNFQCNPFTENYSNNYSNNSYTIIAEILNKARQLGTSASTIIVAANRDISPDSQGVNGVKTLQKHPKYAREIVVISMGNQRIYSKKETPYFFDTIDDHT